MMAAPLRERGAQAGEVTPIELFFDLVYVLAVTQLTRHLVANLTLRGTLETAILLLAVWGAWIQIAWITNYFDLSSRPARLVLIGLMLASLVMSSSLNRAYAGHGVAFAAGVSASILGAQVASLVAVGRRHALTAVFVRAFIWWIPVCVGLIAGGLVSGDARVVAWLLAIALYYLATAAGFPLPRMGRSHTTDYTIIGGHMGHRCFLFITIALGESILVIGSQFGELSRTSSTIAAFVVAFIGSVAFWWIYFDRSAEAGLEVIATASDPGRLGLTAYTFFHVPMVAGIIVAAAGYELAIAHPGNQLNVATACLILGGPALFLIGQAPRARVSVGAGRPSSRVDPRRSRIDNAGASRTSDDRRRRRSLVAFACWDAGRRSSVKSLLLEREDAGPSQHPIAWNIDRGGRLR
jgi:low temperature requirement protein LtrA